MQVKFAKRCAEIIAKYVILIITMNTSISLFFCGWHIYFLYSSIFLYISLHDICHHIEHSIINVVLNLKLLTLKNDQHKWFELWHGCICIYTCVQLYFLIHEKNPEFLCCCICDVFVYINVFFSRALKVNVLHLVNHIYNEMANSRNECQISPYIIPWHQVLSQCEPSSALPHAIFPPELLLHITRDD